MVQVKSINRCISDLLFDVKETQYLAAGRGTALENDNGLHPLDKHPFCSGDAVKNIPSQTNITLLSTFGFE